ncbi:SDR family NAD(P)-dependent oxidoreductase [Cerasicoccus arenae]|uniref:NAD-dependent epimerase n=1 Tax=Cerasicoccus arenae TaxID=424488 RepID=A0A8J3GD98_9BACT|nr:SDR family NAD(P)-dependent oxidoreductase [Cerasicoccus arenae]MBK1858632.1 SDR family NAD(P)-dependent oxidoreductase [Cerasicoccus arenae]GHC04878.1 NAD-dependent epimerase [Cerasicoccus arenae]
MPVQLVTGAAGFIGQQTASQLLARGDHVIGVDNLNDYYDVRLKDYRRQQLDNHENFSFRHIDIEDAATVDALFDEFPIETVFNLAARAGVRYSMENPHVYLSTNAEGTLNLLEGMRRHDCQKLVLASTSSLYAGQKMPFTEDLPVNTPLSPYAASKKAAEVMAYSYHHLYGFDVSVVRFFTVFGPCGRPDMSIYRFIKWIDEGVPILLFGDGEQSRDFTFVEDVAAGAIAAEKKVGYEIFNIGGGRNPISLNTIIGWIEEALGKKAEYERKPFHCADMMETWADISKAERLLDWTPKIDVRDGLQRCVDWYLENKSWLKDIEV